MEDIIYYIKIQAKGIYHEQTIEDVEGLEILKAVLDKIQRDAAKNVEKQNP